MGSCPRCGGVLDFLSEEIDEEYVPGPDFTGHQLADSIPPALVLGLPRWSTTR